MAGKQIILVTGANSGLGLETVKALWKSPRSYHLIVAGRSPERVEQAVKEVEVLPSPGSSSVEALIVDITSDASIKAASEQVQARHDHIDALVNNAGGIFDPKIRSGEITDEREAWRLSWDLNVSSTHMMTTAFASLLIKSSPSGQQSERRLVFVTSGGASLHEDFHRSGPAEARRKPVPAGWPKPMDTRGFPAYACAKTAVNMLALVWRRTLEQDGVKCFNVSPGFLATNFVGNPDALKALGAKDPAVGGEFIKNVLEGKRDQDEGLTIRDDSVQPW